MPDKDNEIFIENIKLIIYYSDKKNVYIENFLEKNIQISFNPILVNKIYLDLLSSYNTEISKKTKNIIVKFFTERKENNNPETLLYLICNCKNLTKELLQNINKYNITEKDFFNLEETNNYKLFKGLLNEKILEKRESQNTGYVKNTIEKINKIKQRIKSGDILFTDISQFFNKAKPDEEKLFEIIKTISLNNQNNAIDLKIKIDDFYIETIKVIDDLQLIHEDFIVFYLNKEKNNIEELKTIIDELKTGNLNCYKKKYVQKYNNFKNNYYEKAKERANKRKSIFFTTIFLNNQALYKNNDDKCVE